jgi:predicted nucleic acid-binding protein
MIYIDTSAFIKKYASSEFEKGVSNVKGLIRNAIDGRVVLVTSLLTVGECLSVFDKWGRQKYFTQREVLALAAKLFKDLKELQDKNSLIIEPITSFSIISSLDYILTNHITINDAIHLYTAINWKDKLDYFYCSDENLKRACKEEGLKVKDPKMT